MPSAETVEDLEASPGEIRSSVLFLLNFTWLLDIQVKLSCSQLDGNTGKLETLGISANLGLISIWKVFKAMEFGEITEAITTNKEKGPITKPWGQW